jgi:hypothetical protein
MFEGIENKSYYDDWTNPQLDPNSEQFRNAYNSVVNDYGKENADAQLKDWGITLENNIENGNITPDQLPENSPIQKEAEQVTDNNPNNDEVDNDAVADFIKQMETAQPTKQEQDEAAYRQQLNDMQLADDINSNIDNYDMLHFTPEEDKPTEFMWAPGSFMRKDIKDSVNVINSYPTSQKRAALEILARIKSGDIDTYEDMLKANPWMSEEMYDAISSIASNDNIGRIPVITKSSMKRNKAAMENFIEKHPEEAAATLPEGSLKEEAVQAIDGGKDAEVNNKVLNKALNKKGNGVDWDKVKLYEPGEDPYLKVTDEYDWKNNPDYEAEPIEIKEQQKDEDFLGPDEYIDENGNIQVDPNWKPENADEDFVGPDEQLMPLGNRDLIPPDNYNHDFDYSVEELDRQPLPEEGEFESKIVDVNDLGLLKAKPTDIGGSSVGSVSQAPLAQAERHTGGNAIGTKGILPATALHFSPSSVHSSAAVTPKQFNGTGKVGSIGKSLNPLNADASVIQGKQSESSGFVTNNGGNISSGATNFRSSLGHINPAQLPSEVEEHTAPEYESLLEAENLKDALINRINMMLDEIDPRTLKQLGFSPANHYYKRTSLTKLDGATLNMLSEMLEDYTK